MATEVQTQDDQLLVDHSLVDDGVEEEEDEKEDEEEEDGEDEKLEGNLDFLQNFPNFYSMAADMMNQLNGDIPEVMLFHKSVTFV